MRTLQAQPSITPFLSALLASMRAALRLLPPPLSLYLPSPLSLLLVAVIPVPPCVNTRQLLPDIGPLILL